MNGIYWMVLLTMHIYLGFHVLSTTTFDSFCFHFTWLSTKINLNETCKKVPCIKPIHSSSLRPDTNKIWSDETGNGLKDPKDSEYFCKLQADNVCIKYTYIYNNAVANVSYFCGKVIEDQTRAITTNCYAQHIEGYTIEACACESKPNTKPCNATMRHTYSIIITIVATTIPLFVYKISNIP